MDEVIHNIVLEQILKIYHEYIIHISSYICSLIIYSEMVNGMYYNVLRHATHQVTGRLFLAFTAARHK